MKEFQKKIREHLEERGWDALRPSDVAKSIMIEGAELLEIFQWENREAADVRANERQMERIKKELADVMIYCFDLSVILNIDMETALEENLLKVKEKYPAHIFNKESNSSEPGTEEKYWEIKESFREGEEK